jgi:hypothetical protein
MPILGDPRGAIETRPPRRAFAANLTVRSLFTAQASAPPRSPWRTEDRRLKRSVRRWRDRSGLDWAYERPRLARTRSDPTPRATRLPRNVRILWAIALIIPTTTDVAIASATRRSLGCGGSTPRRAIAFAERGPQQLAQIA